jgi:hypothetical protein
MRTRRITISATFAGGLAALPLSTAEAQYYPHQQQPTAKGTTDQLNREELARLQSGSGYSPYYWASGSPWGWGYGSERAQRLELFFSRGTEGLQTRRWSEPDSNSRSRCDGQRYGVRSLKRRLDRRGMTSGAARNGLRFQLVLLRKPFHASDGPFWSGGLRRAVP